MSHVFMMTEERGRLLIEDLGFWSFVAVGSIINSDNDNLGPSILGTSHLFLDAAADTSKIFCRS